MAAALAAAEAYPDRDYTFADGRGGALRLPFPELGRRCRALGAAMLAAGPRPGQAIAIAAVEPYDALRAVFAAFAAGLVPTVLHPPGPLEDPGAHLDGVGPRLAAIAAAALVVDQYCWSILAPRADLAAAGPPLLRLDGLGEGDPARLPDPASIPPDAPALRQFTSGSGGGAKAVTITHRNLAAQSRAIYRDGIGIGPGDRVLSWLPLFHDMGLIGQGISPLREGLSATWLPTAAFLKRPAAWMEAVSRHGATITCAPNFAFDLAARARPARDLDLSRLRVLGCGAEPIHAGVLRRFVEAHRPFGLSPSSLVPCYGLAEHTLAATFSPVGRGLVTEVLDARAYREEGRAVPAPPPGLGNAPATGGRDTVEVVGCGPAFPGHAVEIRDPASGARRGEGEIGEITLRGPSVAAGYHGRDLDTRATFTGAGLRTGDLGYLRHGVLFVTGRIKDLLILNGRNYAPHQVEAVAEGVEGVRPGSAFAFTIPGEGTERLVVLYEARSASDGAVATAIRRAVAARLGITPHAVEARPPRSLPRTTSGKKRRQSAREDYLRGGRGGP